MAVWSTIKFTDLSGINRIDGEYFDQKYLELEQKLNQKKLVPITSLVNVSDGNHMSISKYFTNDFDSVPYYRGQDINDFFLENAEPYRIKNEAFEKGWMKRSYFLPGDVLLSIVGTVGSLSIVPETITKSTGSCKIAILRPKADVDPNFISAFLLSKYGQFQIKRNVRGAVQTGLILKDMVLLKVPIIDKAEMNDIASKIREATILNHKSKSFYTQAIQLLEQELGLGKINFEKPRSYTARFSEVIDFSRFDGEHFQPKYQKYRELIMAYSNGYERLLANVKAIKPDYQLKNHPEKNINYIELSKINAGLGVIENITSIDKNAAPSRAKRLVKSGDVLASSVVGSVEKSALVSELEDGYIASNGFFQFRSDVYTPEFLLLLIKSQFFKEQLHQQSTGGILSAVPDQNLRYLIIPKVKKEVQDQITDKIKKSHQMNRESKNLLEQAKTRVEELIEQSIEANA